MIVLATDARVEAEARLQRAMLDRVAPALYGDTSEFRRIVTVGRSMLDLSNPIPIVRLYDYDSPLNGYQNTRLSNRDRDIFISLIASHEEPSDNLRRAAEDYKRKYM